MSPIPKTAPFAEEEIDLLNRVVGPAAAVHCEVCATVLVEWGGSKSWTAELVARGRPT